MKRFIKTVFVLLAVASIPLPFSANAQEDSKGVSFTAGADVYSNYLWRGTKFSTGPAFQPTVKMTAGGFTAGVWGSFDVTGYSEADPFISYSFPFGLSVGLTSYYYPMSGASFMADSSNAHELNLGFSKGGFSLSGNYILNEASVAGSKGGDVYIQAGYNFKNFGIFVGAGNGWHTLDNDKGDDVFGVCNIGLSTSKEIKVTDSFTVPVTGQVVYNPDTKLMHLVVGFSL